jgi:branched-subunit amino acid aminotransferase/4-amino-4-deoxychorismate lyase
MSAFDPRPCVLDGNAVRDGVVAVSSGAEVLTHGEGLFESLPVVDGRPKFLAAHLRRLDEGARALGLGPGPADAEVRADASTLAALCGGATFALRLVLFRDGARVRRLATATAFPSDAGRPVALVVAAPHLNGPRALAGLKTLNYLVPRLAHRDAAARGADEALFTLPDGTVLEGTRSNAFCVRGGALWTAPLSLPILPGVTRDALLSAARRLGVPVREEPFPLSALYDAEEVFIGASVRGLRPATRLEGRAIGREDGPVTAALKAAYRAEFDAD